MLSGEIRRRSKFLLFMRKKWTCSISEIFELGNREALWRLRFSIDKGRRDELWLLLRYDGKLIHECENLHPGFWFMMNLASLILRPVGSGHCWIRRSIRCRRIWKSQMIVVPSSKHVHQSKGILCAFVTHGLLGSAPAAHNSIFFICFNYQPLLHVGTSRIVWHCEYASPTCQDYP